MKKSILVLAAIVATATLVKAPAAEARGLRIGIGFGSPFGARFGRADPTILERAAEANQRVNAREREVLYGRRTVIISRPVVRHEQAREAKRQEAAAAAAKARTERIVAAAEAQRQAKLSAAARAHAAEIKKTITVTKSATAPVVIAAPAVAAPAAALTGDKLLDAAQQKQNAKAEEVLKSIAKPGEAPVVPDAAQPVRQSGSDVAPFDTGSPVAPVAPATVRVVAPAAVPPAATVKNSPAAECLRFIPGAGVTVKVSCSE